MTHRVIGEWIGLKRQQDFPSIDHLNPQTFSVDWDGCILVRALAGRAPPGVDALEFEFVGRSFRREAPHCSAGARLDSVPPRSLLSLLTPVILKLFQRRTAIIHNGTRPRGRGSVRFRAIGVPFGDGAAELRYALCVLSHKLVRETVPPGGDRTEFLEYRGGSWSCIDGMAWAAAAVPDETFVSAR